MCNAMFLMLFYSTGTPLDLTCISSRALAICWSLFTVITIATYTANLAAHLTVTIPHIPIKNLEELANSAEYIPVVLRGHVLEDIFKVRHLKVLYNLAFIYTERKRTGKPKNFFDPCCCKDQNSQEPIWKRSCFHFYFRTL